MKYYQHRTMINIFLLNLSNNLLQSPSAPRSIWQSAGRHIKHFQKVDGENLYSIPMQTHLINWSLWRQERRLARQLCTCFDHFSRLTCILLQHLIRGVFMVQSENSRVLKKRLRILAIVFFLITWTFRVERVHFFCHFRLKLKYFA